MENSVKRILTESDKVIYCQHLNQRQPEIQGESLLPLKIIVRH